MKQSVIHVHLGGPLIALVGNPNCGKTALFNLLTGSRQKVANYVGVTVEHFASWLGLCPGTRITGGKVMSGKTKRVANRAAQALRLAAAALGAYFRRMCARMDKPNAVTLPHTSWRG